MAKKRLGKPKREVTKRQLSHWQQQRKRQRVILGLGTFIVATVLVIMGAGWYISYYQPLHQTVIRVNKTEFNMDYYIKMLKFYGEGLPIYYMDTMADELIVVIERNELIREGALQLGIAVSNEEVNEKLKSYDPPLSKDYKDVARTELLKSKLLDRHFEQTVPVLAEQRHIMAMFLESESQATDIRTRVEAGEDFAELAGELSLDRFSKDKKGDLGWHPEDVFVELLATSIPGEHAFGSEIGILSQSIYDETKTKGVGYWLVKILDRQQESKQIHIQAILLGSEKEAQDVRARLEASEDFTTLAKELSQHIETRGNGGDFDWVSLEDVAPGSAFAAWADIFELETEVISEPIRDDTKVTTGGYWLLKVLDKESNRQISDDDRNSLKTRALDEWILSLLYDPGNEINSYLTDEMKGMAIEKATEG
ncbi:peptidylprolyl isomerase [Chloroflexota bacterium]